MTRQRARKAWKAGYDAGKAAGSWVLDGNSTKHDAIRILEGYEDGDPLVMDMQPSPLSGEWAGASIPELSRQLGIDLDHPDKAQDYEDGYSEGYWDEVIRSAKSMLDK